MTTVVVEQNQENKVKKIVVVFSVNENKNSNDMTATIKMRKQNDENE